MSSQGHLRLTVFPNDRVAARTLARRLADAIVAQPSLVLGLATGRTPIRLYHELSHLVSRGQADLSQVRTFNLDEFVGFDGSHPGSYRQFMQTHLFGPAGIPAEHIHFLNGAAPNLEEECDRYEAAIADAGGIDIQILGIGTNGHIGFNEPARELCARTHRVALKASTRHSNAGLFGGDEAAVPKEALSMGMGTILRAKSIVLLATGKSKASCVSKAVQGLVTPRMPASFLQLHRDVELVLDEAAAKDLRDSERSQSIG
jgi:glucosamine-6-phosphate deaminase